MFCPNCGTPNPDDAKFCPSCGTSLSTNGAQNQQNPSENQPQPQAPGNYRVGIPFRSIAVCILLSIVTCGIYAIIWNIRMVDELNYASGRPNDTSGGLVFLLGLVTCGIYTFFWMYTAGDKVAEIRRRNGFPATSDGILYLILCIFGFSIVSYAMIQNELNKVAAPVAKPQA